MELDAACAGAARRPEGLCPREVWAYRNAAWAIEALRVEQDVGLIYRTMGRKGLEGIANVGPRMAEVIESLIRAGLPEHGFITAGDE